jgi:menaquinone-9 beta-reductase
MTRTDRYDIVVVGARCAGAATSLMLAREGARVLVVERDAPDTDTLSTHALMRGAVMLLADWGLVPGLRAAGTPPITVTTFAYGDEHVVVPIRPGHGVEALIAPRRHLLDAQLVAAARAAGAEIRHRTALTGVVVGPEGAVSGVRLVGPEGEAQVRAGLVIGADGRRSSLARMVGAEVTRSGRHAAAVAYTHLPGLPDRGTRWHYGPGIAGGAIPTNDGTHCVFASVSPDRFRAELRGDLAKGFRRLLAEIDPELAAVAAGRDAPPRAFAGAPGFFRRAQGRGWALVGDAGYFKDPITAHGITDAFRDAFLLSRAVLNGEPLSSYEEARDALSAPLFDVTDRIAALPRDMEALKALHFELNAAAKAEQAWLVGALVPGRRAA